MPGPAPTGRFAGWRQQQRNPPRKQQDGVMLTGLPVGVLFVLKTNFYFPFIVQTIGVTYAHRKKSGKIQKATIKKKKVKKKEKNRNHRYSYLPERMTTDILICFLPAFTKLGLYCVFPLSTYPLKLSIGAFIHETVLWI